MTHTRQHKLLHVLFALALFSSCSEGEPETLSSDGPGSPSNESPNNTPDNNASNNVGGCSSDSECAETEVCDVGEGLCRPACQGDSDCSADTTCGPDGFCVSRQTCSEDDPCPQQEVCNTCKGRCEISQGERTCTVDMNCLIDQFCDPCRKVCRPLGAPCDTCETDLECGGAADLCLDFTQGGRFCAQNCSSDSDCPRAFVCETEVQQCVPASGDCSSPAQCEDASDCPPGEQCGSQLVCVPGCSQGSCPNEEVCDNGACVAPCAGDSDCPPGAECQESGLCKIPGGCLSSRDCPETGTYCDLEAQRCVEGCEVDSDCPGLQVCRGNQCQQRPCDGNHLCAFGQVCDFDSGRCIEPNGPFCDPCDADAENQCGGEPNQCLRLSDDEGNALGDFCAPVCDPDNIDACPVGYRCQELQDENMQTIANVCFRNCTRGPI